MHWVRCVCTDLPGKRDPAFQSPVDEVSDLIQAGIKRVIALDGDAMAAQVGNPLSLNMVMLGALIGSGSIGVTADVMKKTIEELTKKAFLESNLKAFDLGYESAKSQ